jgi:hypothetical protein
MCQIYAHSPLGLTIVFFLFNNARIGGIYIIVQNTGEWVAGRTGLTCTAEADEIQPVVTINM